MSKPESICSMPGHGVGVLKTKFVTQDQTAALMQIIDLALEDIDQVAGGLAVQTIPTCQCVNCCSH